jgi:hypothetical protein
VIARAEGRWYVSYERPGDATWEEVAPGASLTVAGVPWVVTERGGSALASAEGELPYPVDPRASGRYADLEGPEGAFATLDFGPPLRFFASRELSAAELVGRVVYSEQTPYQRIAITQAGGGQQLYLNGNLQFNSVDEYRYLEALVHPAMFAAQSKKSILVLGGGDGLAVREILRHPEVEQVTLVELDPAMIRLARGSEPIRQLNDDALADPRVNRARRRPGLARSRAQREVRRADRRLPGPEQLLARQALQHLVLRGARTTCPCHKRTTRS